MLLNSRDNVLVLFVAFWTSKVLVAIAMLIVWGVGCQVSIKGKLKSMKQSPQLELAGIEARVSGAEEVIEVDVAIRVFEAPEPLMYGPSASGQ